MFTDVSTSRGSIKRFKNGVSLRLSIKVLKMLFCECIIIARSQNCTKLPYLTLFYSDLSLISFRFVYKSSWTFSCLAASAAVFVFVTQPRRSYLYQLCCCFGLLIRKRDIPVSRWRQESLLTWNTDWRYKSTIYKAWLWSGREKANRDFSRPLRAGFKV